MAGSGAQRWWTSRPALGAAIALGWAIVAGASSLLAQPAPDGVERSAQIRAGACGEIGSAALFDLGPVGVGRSDDEDGDRDDAPAGAFMGSAGAIPVAVSASQIPTTLDELLAQPHAVVITAGGPDDPVVACGEIGGYLRDREEVFIGLIPQGDEMVSGVAFLEEDDGRDVEVTVYLADASGLTATPTA